MKFKVFFFLPESPDRMRVPPFKGHEHEQCATYYRWLHTEIQYMDIYVGYMFLFAFSLLLLLLMLSGFRCNPCHAHCTPLRWGDVLPFFFSPPENIVCTYALFTQYYFCDELIFAEKLWRTDRRWRPCTISIPARKPMYNYTTRTRKFFEIIHTLCPVCRHT